MDWGDMAGLGEGLLRVSDQMQEDSSRKRDEESYMRRLEAAEKARDARDAADRARQAEIERATPVERRTFLGDNAEGPPDVRFESVNRFGEPVASGSASEGERSMFQQGLLRESQAAKAAAEKMRLERERFEQTEAGKDRRARMSADRPLGQTQGPAPQLFQLPSGEQIWVKPGDPVPRGARRINPYTPSASEDSDSSELNPDEYLSRYR